MPFPGIGRNTAYGPDDGPPPPRGYGAPAGFGPAYPQQPAAFYPPLIHHQPAYWQPHCQASTIPRMVIPGQAGYYGAAANPTTGQLPAKEPVIQPNIPSINMTNSTGGVGCEAGYNYMFFYSHTKIHVLLCGADPPWSLKPNWAIDFHAVHVPTNTTIRDLMKAFGATNEDPRLNKVFEVHPGGNGTWYKGMSFSGDDLEAMAKTIKEVGWDDTRNGQPGGKSVVWLYVVKG